MGKRKIEVINLDGSESDEESPNESSPKIKAINNKNSHNSPIKSKQTIKKHRNIEERNKTVEKYNKVKNVTLARIAKKKEIHPSTLSRDKNASKKNGGSIPQKERGKRPKVLNEKHMQQVKELWSKEMNPIQKNLKPIIEEVIEKSVSKGTISLYYNKYFISEEDKLKRILAKIKEQKEFNFTMNTTKIYCGDKSKLVDRNVNAGSFFDNFSFNALAWKFTNECEHIALSDTIGHNEKVLFEMVENLRKKKPNAKFFIIPLCRAKHWFLLIHDVNDPYTKFKKFDSCVNKIITQNMLKNYLSEPSSTNNDNLIDNLMDAAIQDVSTDSIHCGDYCLFFIELLVEGFSLQKACQVLLANDKYAIANYRQLNIKRIAKII